MAGMNQRNNDCTVYTPCCTDGLPSLSPYGETDFNRAKTSNNLTSSVVFSFISCYLWEPRSKRANPASTESVVN